MLHSKKYSFSILHSPAMFRLLFFVCLLLAFLLHTAPLQAQSPSLKDFYQEFEETQAEDLHIYAFARIPADFSTTSRYPFKGARLDTSYFSLMEKLLDPYSSYLPEDAFFALSRYYLTGRYEGLLLREYRDAGGEHHIHLLIYDNESQRMVHHQTLAYGYGYEGSMGGQESWIVDINQDGQLDLLSRQWENTSLET